MFAICFTILCCLCFSSQNDAYAEFDTATKVFELVLRHTRTSVICDFTDILEAYSSLISNLKLEYATYDSSSMTLVNLSLKYEMQN